MLNNVKEKDEQKVVQEKIHTCLWTDTEKKNASLWLLFSLIWASFIRIFFFPLKLVSLSFLCVKSQSCALYLLPFVLSPFYSILLLLFFFLSVFVEGTEEHGNNKYCKLHLVSHHQLQFWSSLCAITQTLYACHFSQSFSR